ncbi:MAG TPA: YbjN domain-containing protein [Gemmatimonadales bacterium]|nr:YbjN domain-containing protein [Gemmatimonadales bacterium]
MPTLSLRRVVRVLAVAGGAALMTAALPATLRAQDVMTTVSDKHMESLLTGMGFDVTKTKDHTWKFELSGYKVLLFLENDNSDGQLYVGFSDLTVTGKKMNEWNKSKRFARAYADDDENPVLESDLDFAGGVTDDAIKAWIKLYRSQVVNFVKFINN